MAGTILLVEDEENIAALIKDIFDLYDQEILHAASAREATKLLNRQPVDLVILDISLPDKSGMELYKELLPHHPELQDRVIFMSGYSPEHLLDEEMAGEMPRQFIQKPFNLFEFRKMIEPYVRQKG